MPRIDLLLNVTLDQLSPIVEYNPSVLFPGILQSLSKMRFELSSKMIHSISNSIVTSLSRSTISGTKFDEVTIKSHSDYFNFSVCHFHSKIESKTSLTRAYLIEYHLEDFLLDS